jgi:NADH-quinone oxidoreductase subunit N
VTTFGAFAVVQALEERGIATVDGCAGAGRGFAGVSAILFLGLAGVPPTVGFAGRFAVLGGLARSGRLGLALAACVAACAALSFYYYGRILTRMLRAGGGAARAPVAWAAAGLTLLLGVFWSPLFDLARSCAAGMLPR